MKYNFYYVLLTKQVRKLNWIAEPELYLLSNVTFIISILVVFPQTVTEHWIFFHPSVNFSFQVIFQTKQK